MNVILDYLLHRPISACIQGVVMGLMFPLALASLLGNKVGSVWALVLAPLWIAMMVLTIPVSVLYCFVMVMLKGPLWQYPPEKRGKPIDWASFDAGPDRRRQ